VRSEQYSTSPDKRACLRECRDSQTRRLSPPPSRVRDKQPGSVVLVCGHVPEVSRFFGIVIRMYFDDHNPPHFHAFYGGSEAQFGIEPIAILSGALPSRAASMVLKWAALHQRKLMQNWRRRHSEEPLERIDPLQ
jgi:Domain of unknown function (DUF4160)